MNHVIESILARSAQSKLQEPAPDDALLNTLIACAASAPDHALLRPWRFLAIRGAGRQALGDLFLKAAMADQADAMDEEAMQRLQAKALRAPLILVAITQVKEHPKVPPIEQVMSAAAGVGYLLLALQSAGFGGIWRTGPMARHPVVARGLGLADAEQINGFIYIGTPTHPRAPTQRPDAASLWSEWLG